MERKANAVIKQFKSPRECSDNHTRLLWEQLGCIVLDFVGNSDF